MAETCQQQTPWGRDRACCPGKLPAGGPSMDDFAEPAPFPSFWQVQPRAVVLPKTCIVKYSPGEAAGGAAETHSAI